MIVIKNQMIVIKRKKIPKISKILRLKVTLIYHDEVERISDINISFMILLATCMRTERSLCKIKIERY